MKLSASAILTFAAATLVFTGCKPKEEAAPTPPAATTPAAATNIVANAPAPVATPAESAPAPAAPAAADTVLSPTEAKDHIGENATVKGKVFGVHVTAKGDAFINVGAAFPNAPFVAVCFQGKIPAEELKALDGKTVAFTGKIKEHQGKAEIILDAADQFKAE